MLFEKRLKVPNGKLLIIKAEIINGIFKKISIQGDFFFYPEDKIVLFEKAIVSTPRDALKDVLNNIVEENNLELVGLTVNSVCELVNEIRTEANIIKMKMIEDKN